MERKQALVEQLLANFEKAGAKSEVPLRKSDCVYQDNGFVEIHSWQAEFSKYSESVLERLATGEVPAGADVADVLNSWRDAGLFKVRFMPVYGSECLPTLGIGSNRFLVWSKDCRFKVRLAGEGPEEELEPGVIGRSDIFSEKLFDKNVPYALHWAMVLGLCAQACGAYYEFSVALNRSKSMIENFIHEIDRECFKLDNPEILRLDDYIKVSADKINRKVDDAFVHLAYDERVIDDVYASIVLKPDAMQLVTYMKDGRWFYTIDTSRFPKGGDGLIAEAYRKYPMFVLLSYAGIMLEERFVYPAYVSKVEYQHNDGNFVKYTVELMEKLSGKN